MAQQEKAFAAKLDDARSGEKQLLRAALCHLLGTMAYTGT